MIMILAVVIAVVSVVLSWLWKLFRKPVGKNPFSVSSLAEPTPIVLDQKQRKKVLKKKFSPGNVPSDLDAIVIGSGIGGLGVASILSKAGWKVLVLEQHGRLGGCCHTFKDEKGREFDVGIHYIGEMGHNTIVRNLSDQITNGKLDWTPLSSTYDTVVMRDINWHFPISDRGEWIEELKQEFPDEKENIKHFFDMLESQKGIFTEYLMGKVLPLKIAQFLVRTGLMRKMAPTFYSLVNDTVWDTVCKFTENQRLRTMFVYMFMNYGTNPEKAGWIMHSVIMRHYKYGAYYPKGGSSEIPYTLVPVIEESGGAALAKANVEQILVDAKGRAHGVRVQGHDIHAQVIISDAGVTNTFGKLVPKELASKSRYLDYLRDVGCGETVIQVFVGLRGTTEELGLKATNYWVYGSGATWNEDLKKFLGRSLDEILDAPESEKIPLMFVSFPSAKDPIWEEKCPGNSVCVVCGPASYDWFRQWKDKEVSKRGEDYEYRKNVLGHRYWAQACEVFPHLADKVESIDVGSPLTHSHYLAASSGEIYGLDHGKARFKPEVVVGLRPETDIPGLYLTGQDVTCAGFAGAMMGGMLCASKLLNRNLLDDLIAVKKQREKNK